MPRTGFYTDERTFWHATGMQALFLPVGDWVQPPGGTAGADTPDSKRRLLNLANASGLTRKLVMADSVPATVEDACRIHPRGYIDNFKRASAAGGGDLGRLAPFSKGGFEIAMISCGLAISAVDDVLTGEVDNAYALCRPAGHHCLADMPMGFCLLANIPIAIEVAKARRGISRVAVVDWDVHHGNGTQDIFWDDASVLYCSTHQMPLYPGTGARDETGAGNIVNAPLSPNTGGEVFRDAFSSRVLPALDAFAPDLIIVSAGFDAHRRDPLAEINLDEGDFDWATGKLMERAGRHAEGRLVSLLEGGYDLQGLAFSVAAHVGRLMKG